MEPDRRSDGDMDKKVSEKPSALVLTDELHPRGLSRLQVDELSGRLYGWLKKKQIGGGILY